MKAVVGVAREASGCIFGLVAIAGMLLIALLVALMTAEAVRYL